jgi:hypothetical protein
MLRNVSLGVSGSGSQTYYLAMIAVNENWLISTIKNSANNCRHHRWRNRGRLRPLHADDNMLDTILVHECLITIRGFLRDECTIEAIRIVSRPLPGDAQNSREAQFLQVVKVLRSRVATSVDAWKDSTEIYWLPVRLLFGDIRFFELSTGYSSLSVVKFPKILERFRAAPTIADDFLSCTLQFGIKLCATWFKILQAVGRGASGVFPLLRISFIPTWHRLHATGCYVLGRAVPSTRLEIILKRPGTPARNRLSARHLRCYHKLLFQMADGKLDSNLSRGKFYYSQQILREVAAVAAAS